MKTTDIAEATCCSIFTQGIHVSKTPNTPEYCGVTFLLSDIMVVGGKVKACSLLVQCISFQLVCLPAM